MIRIRVLASSERARADGTCEPATSLRFSTVSLRWNKLPSEIRDAMESSGVMLVVGDDPYSVARCDQDKGISTSAKPHRKTSSHHETQSEKISHYGNSSREPFRMPRAIEKDDCFTCTSKKRHCDRQLHHCKTCEESSDICRYPIILRWRRGEPTTRRKRQTLAKSKQYLSQLSHNNLLGDAQMQRAQHMLNMLPATDTCLEPYAPVFSPDKLERDASSSTYAMTIWPDLVGASETPSTATSSVTPSIMDPVFGEDDCVSPASTLLQVSDLIMTQEPLTDCVEEVSAQEFDNVELLPLTGQWTSHSLSYQHMHLTRPGEISSLFDICRYSHRCC